MGRGVFWLVAVATVLYIGVNYGWPHFRAWRFRDAMNQQVRLSGSSSEEEIRREIAGTAERLGVPLRPLRLRVDRAPRGSISIAASWQEIVTIEGGPLGTWIDTLRFDYEVSSAREGR